jgi:hypothetical protein
MNDIAFTRVESEARPAFFFDDARDVRLRDARVNGRVLEEGGTEIRRKNSGSVEIIK